MIPCERPYKDEIVPNVSDPAVIAYRQEVGRDCLKSGAAVGKHREPKLPTIQDNAVRDEPFCVHSNDILVAGRNAMKAFLLACVVAIAAAAVGAMVLNHVQEPVEQAFATTGVRL